MVSRKRPPQGPRQMRVLVAAPRDLVVERRAARDTIERWNCGSKDARFILLGEDGVAAPEGRSAAADVNAGVEACDLFVLILYRRWGQELPCEAACTSGTEITFHLALERFQRTGKPEILVFFKNLDIGSMADPGHQLTRVMRFRRVLEGMRQIRFHTFDDIEEFQDCLARSLQAYARGELPVADEARAPVLLPRECLQAVERAQSELQRLAIELEASQEAEARTVRQAERELTLARQAAAAAARGHMEEAQQTFAQATDETLNVSVLSLAFEFYYRIGKLDAAEAMLNRALAASGSGQPTQEAARVRANLGLIHEQRGELDRAEAMFRQALAMDEQLGHIEGLARDYDNLGLIYERRGELRRAEEMLRKTLALHEQQGHEAGLATVYSRLGLIYQARGDLERAEEMLRKAVAIDQRLKRQEALANDYSSLGLICQVRGQVGQARQLWLQAKDIYAAVGLHAMVRRLQDSLDALAAAERGSNHQAADQQARGR